MRRAFVACAARGRARCRSMASARISLPVGPALSVSRRPSGCAGEARGTWCWGREAASLPTPRQGHYVAANSFLDAFVHHARACGVPALAVNWGPLTGGGMLPADAIGELARLGVGTQPIDEALQALDSLIAGRDTQAVLAKI